MDRLKPSVCVATASLLSLNVTSTVVRLRAEVEGAILNLGPHVPSLDQVQRPGHHSHVDALLGGAALDVADITVKRGHKHLPRAFGVQIGQDGSVHNEA